MAHYAGSKSKRANVHLHVWSLCAANVVGLMAGSEALAQAVSPVNQNVLLAKANPDECFVGIGDLNNTYVGTPIVSQNIPVISCAVAPFKGGVPKVNQAYVWGLAQSPNTTTGSSLWFGTAANVECLVLGAYLGLNKGFQTPSYVCEFGQNATGFKSDWRPPQLWAYDLSTKKLTDHSNDGSGQTAAKNFLLQTIGIRSAGSITVGSDNLVFLAGPTFVNTVNLFVFKNSVYLGAQQLTSDVAANVYSDIRQWVLFNGVLYTGVGVKGGGGRVLRWTGTAASPFSFKEVGVTDAEVAYLISHRNSDGTAQLYATTWGGALGGAGGQGPASGLWSSPVVPAGGLTVSTTWTKRWDVSKYEPDPATAQTQVGGALSSYNGQIYWGLMQVPFTGLVAHYKAYPNAPSGGADQLLSLVNTTRPVPIFRYNPQGNVTQLLYGSFFLPVWDATKSSWVTKANASYQMPLFGPAGFGNPFNTYTWASAVFKNRLYFGTFDWSYLACESLPQISRALNLTMPINVDCSQLGSKLSSAYGDNLNYQFGADFWRFDDPNKAANAESVDGLGNNLNYGVRTLVSDSNNLYVGMADPMNLKTPPGAPAGGWELRVLTPNSTLPLVYQK